MSSVAESAAEMNQHLDPRDSDVFRKTVKAPNRKKFEEELDSLNAAILGKEAELAKIKAGQSNQDDKARPDLASIRAEKNVNMDRRKQIEKEMRDLNQGISKKTGELTKVQSNLPYKKEEKINDAIRKLEQQLTMTNFRLSEEKKIVAEIDSLKRSKKSLEQYTAIKKEIDAMRDRLRRMREERDYYYKSVTNLKQKEDEMRKRTQNCRSQAAVVKKEIDELYEQKRHLLADFKNQEKDYQTARDEWRRKQRLDERRRKDNEKPRNRSPTYPQQIGAYEAWREPYEEEKQLCSTLIAYLQPHLITNELSPSSSLEQQSDSTDLGSSKELETEGMYLLRKKSDENLFSGVSRTKANKRHKRDRRRPSNKPITHTPETFAQFAKLGLKAPSSTSEVSATIQQLVGKKVELEMLSQPQIQVEHGASGGASSDSTGAPSCTESGIPSMPSTPEVQLDSLPPQFSHSPDSERHRRRLSGDSGLLEDHCSGDELLTDEKVAEEADSMTAMTTMTTKFDKLQMAGGKFTSAIYECPNCSQGVARAMESSEDLMAAACFVACQACRQLAGSNTEQSCEARVETVQSS